MNYLKEYNIFDNLPEKTEFDSVILNEIYNGMKFIDYIKNDEQLDRSHENYMGFVNVALDFMDRDPIMQQNFKHFIKHVKNMEPMLDAIGLELEPHPDEEETIIHNK